MDMDLFQPDDIPEVVGNQTLICTCPKCSVKIELDLVQISENNLPRTCPECKTRFVLTKESFVRRASRKAGEINCAQCGGPLDHTQYCPSCKTLYPDYYVAEFPDAVKKRAHKGHDFFGGFKNLSFEWRSGPSPSTSYDPMFNESEPRPETVGRSRKNITTGVSAAILVVLVAVGASVYYHVKSKKEYAETYIVALYGIKTGTDTGLNLCSKISADWVAKGGGSQNTPPRLSADDESQLNGIKSSTDSYLNQLKKPPSAYADAHKNLFKLNDLFLKLHAAVSNPSGTVTTFIDQVQKTEAEFKTTSADLKKNLPTELTEELNVARAKYRGLKDF